MYLSSVQKLQNDIVGYEQTSDHKIALDKYFIVRIESLDTTIDLTDFTKKDILAKTLLHTSIICGYVYYNTAYILYSSVDVNNGHFLDGSHQHICSHYASNCAIKTQKQAKCSLIEFDTRTKILAYFQTKIFENMKESMVYHSHSLVTPYDIAKLSFGELIEKFDAKTESGWSGLSSYECYGSFYKLQIKGSEKKFAVLSELIDMHHSDKYTAYLFS